MDNWGYSHGREVLIIPGASATMNYYSQPFAPTSPISFAARSYTGVGGETYALDSGWVAADFTVAANSLVGTVGTTTVIQLYGTHDASSVSNNDIDTVYQSSLDESLQIFFKDDDDTEYQLLTTAAPGESVADITLEYKYSITNTVASPTRNHAHRLTSTDSTVISSMDGKHIKEIKIIRTTESAESTGLRNFSTVCGASTIVRGHILTTINEIP